MATKKLQILGNLGGSNVELDSTLTQEGKAADAKAVGDAINSAVEQKSQVQIITWEADD